MYFARTRNILQPVKDEMNLYDMLQTKSEITVTKILIFLKEKRKLELNREYNFLNEHS